LLYQVGDAEPRLLTVHGVRSGPLRCGGAIYASTSATFGLACRRLFQRWPRRGHRVPRVGLGEVEYAACDSTRDSRVTGLTSTCPLPTNGLPPQGVLPAN